MAGFTWQHSPTASTFTGSWAPPGQAVLARPVCPTAKLLTSLPNRFIRLSGRTNTGGNSVDNWRKTVRHNWTALPLLLAILPTVCPAPASASDTSTSPSGLCAAKFDLHCSPTMAGCSLTISDHFRLFGESVVSCDTPLAPVG